MLYHLILKHEWDQIEGGAYYAPPSLKSEGFIHLSSKEQVPKTYQRFFEGQETLLLEIDEKKLQAPLKYEDADNDSFPHLYGKLNLDAVVQVSSFKK